MNRGVARANVNGDQLMFQRETLDGSSDREFRCGGDFVEISSQFLFGLPAFSVFFLRLALQHVAVWRSFF